jgi:hypothetical protein
VLPRDQNFCRKTIKRAEKYFEVMEKSGDILKKGSKCFKLVGNTD